MADEINGKISLIGHAPTVRIVRTETQRVACPYCAGEAEARGLAQAPGYTEVTAEISPGLDGRPQMQIRDFNTPKKCVVCSRYFQLEPVLQVRGVPIPGE